MPCRRLSIPAAIWAAVAVLLFFTNLHAAPAYDVREYALKHISVSDEILSTVRHMLAAEDERAVMVTDNNSIVVTASEGTLSRVASLVEIMDRPPVQILIEARVVEVGKGSVNEFGIEWQGEHHEPSANVFGKPGVVDNTFAVNLPTSGAPAGTLGYGFITSNHSLDMVISALESKREAKSVSSPSIQVLNNHRAVISDGIEFIVPWRDAPTVLSTEANTPRGKTEPTTYGAKLELAVIPRAAGKGQVSMALEVRREEFDMKVEIQGYPPKRTKSARTDVTLKSGYTVVIGGITTQSTLNKKSGVPVLSKIPLLGWFFKGSQKGDEESELMIFITPTIVAAEAPGPEG